MGIYNGVWQHLYRRYVRGEVPIDKSELLPNYDEANGTEIPSGAGVFVAPDKDSVNGS